MLVPRTSLARKAFLSVRQPSCQAYQPWFILVLRKLHSESESPPVHRKGFQGGQSERRFNQTPNSDLALKESSEIVVDESKLANSNTSIKYRKVPPRQATIQANKPSTTTKEKILTSLKAFRPTSKHWKALSQDKEQAVVILATPRFSKWLEDDSFIASFLEIVTRSVTTNEKSKIMAKPEMENQGFKPPELDVLCACVDGLSPDIDWIPHAMNHPAKEGFSILQGRTSEVLPNLWKSNSSPIAKSPTMTASLTFGTRETARYQSHVVLPLANTLFSNGRHSTLLVSKWSFEKGAYERVKSGEKSDQTITVFKGRRLSTRSMRVPVTPLTPARRIVKGLGNIVKQIDFGGSDAEPASRELEANIDEYLQITKREKSTVAVWALVVPKKAIPNTLLPSPESELLFDTNRVKSQWQLTDPNYENVGYWLDRGAKLCRVLSGGGGWGVKQGLLALDPQSTYKETSEARFDFSTGSLEEQQTSALGSIAEPDAYIQFFAANNTRPIVAPYMRARPKGVDMWRTSIVVGSVPSTIDNLQIDRPDSSTADVVLLRGHFGAVSESGMFLNTASVEHRASKGQDKISKRQPVETKIDLPYSYISRDLRLEAKPPGFKSKSSIRPSQEAELQPALQIRKHFIESSVSSGKPDQESEPTFRLKRHPSEKQPFRLRYQFHKPTSPNFVAKDPPQETASPSQQLDKLLPIRRLPSKGPSADMADNFERAYIDPTVIRQTKKRPASEG